LGFTNWWLESSESVNNHFTHAFSWWAKIIDLNLVHSTVYTLYQKKKNYQQQHPTPPPDDHQKHGNYF